MKKEMYSHIHGLEETHWWYVARRKIIFDWVWRILPDYPAPRILDVGCGTGLNLEYLRSHHYPNIIGLDFSTEALYFGRERRLPGLICGDGVRPPLRCESFDMIMALDLIEHLEDDISALQELVRLLKQGGTLVIFTPAFNFLWGLQDEVGQHYRRYTTAELQKKLEASGLKVKKLTYTNTFLFPLVLAGRLALRLVGNKIQATSENDLHPGWSNNLLLAIFAAEQRLLRYFNLPFGVSVFCIAHKPTIS